MAEWPGSWLPAAIRPDPNGLYLGGWGGSPRVGFLAKNLSFSLHESLVCVFVCVQAQGAAVSQLHTSKVGEQAV